METMERLNIYYWIAGRGIAEVGFVVDNGSNVIPVEVKAEIRLQAKSLKVYREKFQLKLSIWTSMADYRPVESSSLGNRDYEKNLYH